MQLPDLNHVLLLAPHPDDGEFGCGATLKKLTDQGTTVHYAAFSPCIKSLPEGLPEDTLFTELNKATQWLGIPEKQIITYRFPVREFPAHRQEILETLINLRKQINPGLVLLPNTKDIHQDHQVISREGIRAFKQTRILGYELPWNSFTFTNTCHSVVERSHIEAKMAALKEYHSQEFRSYHDEEFFFGLARTRGTQIGVRYAEAFEVIRWIL